MTPRQLSIRFSAAAERQARERDGQMALAWNIEALHRTKKLPALESTLARKSKTPPKQTWEAQAALLSAW